MDTQIELKKKKTPRSATTKHYIRYTTKSSFVVLFGWILRMVYIHCAPTLRVSDVQVWLIFSTRSDVQVHADKILL